MLLIFIEILTIPLFLSFDIPFDDNIENYTVIFINYQFRVNILYLIDFN
jgi:hypothetical protein